MPTKPNKKVELAERRQRVAALYVQGWTQQAIAEHLAISQTSVSFDLKHLRHEWRQSSIRDFDTLREVELKKLEYIERESWAAWERSQKPLQSAVVNGEGGTARARKTVCNQHGDPRYLEQVHRCVAQRRALLGLDAPTLIAPVLPARRCDQLSPEQHEVLSQLRQDMLNNDDYLEYLRNREPERKVGESADATDPTVIDLPRLNGHCHPYGDAEPTPAPGE